MELLDVNLLSQWPATLRRAMLALLFTSLGLPKGLAMALWSRSHGLKIGSRAKIDPFIEYHIYI